MTQDTASELAPGSVVGGWTVGRKLGEGAMGVVYEARDRSGRVAALKIVRPELLVKPDNAARFKREGKLLQRIRHRNVVELLDVGEANGVTFLALEFIDGESLDKVIARGPLPPDQGLRVATDLLRGLAAIHDAGIVHRDVKPGNLMLGRDGAWKITDFGLARRETEESIAVTRPGQVMGTPLYMSPEMCLGEAIDLRSDLYCAGVTLFHAVAGEPPFSSKSLMDLIRAHIVVPAPILATRTTAAPPALSDLVAKLLQKKREERPANARAALALIGVDEPAAPPLAASSPSLPHAETTALAPVARAEATPYSHAETTAMPAATAPAPAPTPAPAVTPAATPAPTAQPAEPAARGRKTTRRFRTGLATDASAPTNAAPANAPATTEPGAGSARRVRLTPSGRVPGIKIPEVAKRGSRIPWERAFLPMTPAVLALISLLLIALGLRLDRWLVPWTLYATATAGMLIGAARVFMGFYEVNAPPMATAKTFWERVEARRRARSLARSKPRQSADALLELGEHAEAAELLVASGFLRDAAEVLQSVQEHVKAARLYERLKDVDAAIAAYTAAKDMRAVTLALETDRVERAAEILVKLGKLEQAADTWQNAGRPLEAAGAFEQAGRLADAGGEILRALERKDGPVAKFPKDERRAYAGRAADLILRGGATAAAAKRLEALGELDFAQSVFEKSGELLEAARLATKLGHHHRAAELYTQAGKTNEAAKARGEALLAAGKLHAIAPNAEAAKMAAKAETPEALATAAKQFEQAGDSRRAADLYARAGQLERAADLYEKAGAWRDASLCHRELGDPVAAARTLENADAVAAAETWALVGKHEEAVRILAKIQSGPRRARAVTLLGDAHLAAGHESEAVEAFTQALDAAGPTERDAALSVAHCIEALANLGKLDQAIEQLAKMRAKLGESPELERLTNELDTKKRTSRGGEDLVGCVVDRYKVIALLGEGGTAWVYDAEHTFLGRRVALKVLKPQPAGGADLASRFYAEAEAVAGLKHPNVIHVFDVGATPGGLLYMALELVKGEGLRKLLETKGRLDAGQATRIMSGVLAGLGAAHAQGIVHRDLKPENILLARSPGAEAQENILLHDMVPKVVDFGIAKVVQGKLHTMTGSFLGTPKYASPEQASGNEATFATDVYAAGLVLYELLSGRSPFESETPLGFLAKHATAEPLPLGDLVNELPRPLAAAVMRALEKDPSKRWPDMESFRRAIEPFTTLEAIAHPAADQHAKTMVEIDGETAES